METATNPFNDFVFIDATPSDRGSFTLATEKALAKLEKFQLPDPSYFVLQWIQALAANQAQRVDIKYTAGGLKGEFEMKLIFDGPGYTRQEVDGLYDHVFRSGRDRAMDRLRELALGWLSAGAMGTTHLSLQSNGRRRVKEGGKERTESPELAPSEQSQLHYLIIRGRGHFPFEEIVRRRCAECTTQLFWNGEGVNSSTTGGVPWPNRPFQTGPTVGVMGATYGSVASHVSFLRYGVEFVSRPERSLQPPVVVRISDPTLSKNVSQTDVVKDEAYEEFLGRLRLEMKKMGLQLTNKRIPSYQRDALNKFLQAYLMSHIDIRVFDDPKRLQMMGEEFHNLVQFPLFSLAGKGYASLAALREEYQRRGYLLYSFDERASMARWHGLLLVLQLEELPVLQKFFSNLTHLSWDEVRNLSRGGMQQKLSEARRRPVICRVPYSITAPIPVLENRTLSVEASVQVPDVYPTGKAVVVQSGDLVGNALPGVEVTLLIEKSEGQLDSTSELAHLQRHLQEPVLELLSHLADRLSEPDISKNQSRTRYAELAAEQLLFLFSSQSEVSSLPAYLDRLDPKIGRCPMIGLENGDLVSVQDLVTYLTYSQQVYLGGAFLDGLESGALDPMPCARKLVMMLLHPGQIISTQDVKREMASNPQIGFELRRQTVMKGLGAHPNPEIALRNFASEAASHAQELERLEKEYKQAMEAKLFVKPDEERLATLASALDFEPASPPTPTQAPTMKLDAQVPGLPEEQDEKKPALPPLEFDLDYLRRELGDFCQTPGAVHVERREDHYTLHLSNRWVGSGQGRVFVLHHTDRPKEITPALPVEGFVRLAEDNSESPENLVKDATEQLVLKVLQAHQEEPITSHHRRRLRAFLLDCCSQLGEWKQSNQRVFRELTVQPLVACAGNRVLSWRQLHDQARRMGQTLVAEPQARSQALDPMYCVIECRASWLEDVFDTLDFPRRVVWRPGQYQVEFELLLRSSVREILNVLSNNHRDLLGPEAVGMLADDASFWTRWRSGFLSWDEHTNTARVNPSHKLAKKLTDRFGPDPSWSMVLACALFSTINRGLAEVEDRHEKEFLLALLDTLH